MFRGNYKNKSSDGKPIPYLNGDVVSFQGKLYQCVEYTKNSPIQSPTNWKYTGVTEQFQSDSPPLNPKQGQIWVSNSGIQYIWFEDLNSSQWIET